MKKLLLSILASVAIFATGCGTSTNIVQPVAPAAAQGTSVTQVEFLARPGIAEALLFDNSLLAAYNAVTPRFVAAAIADPASAAGQAAAPIFAQARTVLDLFEGLNVAVGLTTDQLVGAFLPDVMRIETAGAVADGFRNNGASNPSYGTFNTAGDRLAYGRKLTDDVIDITLTTLTDGAVTTDNTPYYRPAAGAGSTNFGIGHQNLNGQAAPFGASTFPFLAPPN